ncbi:MAG: low temperature requirement protein A [Myxacorys chilensis ATA2-1-KO14]|jgi:low temperature requirement protein LtrA|nr:low temperature requirement protein A [Myxacorys chilensis ATA2-1-KO14]
MSKNLWEPPRLRVGQDLEEERRATWLELFFDLIFVVAIAELGHTLSEDVSVNGFIGFVVLFAPVWWCWVGATFYATRFDTDDLGQRLLTFTQMAIVASLAVNVHYGLSKTAIAFALSYAAFRSVLIIQYLNAGHHIPIARPLSRWYAAGFGLGMLCWLLSIAVPAPWRFLLWLLGLVIDFMTPLTAGRLIQQVPPSLSHIPERMGLFVIIVLGESVLSVVQGISGQVWTAPTVAISLLGLSTAFSAWWLYFDSVDGSPLRAMGAGRPLQGLVWLYGHLPFVVGLGATGIGVGHAIKYATTAIPENDRWLLAVGAVLSLGALALIHYLTCASGMRKIRLAKYRLGSALAVLGVAIVGQNLSPVVFVGLIALAYLVQVALGLRESRSL